MMSLLTVSTAPLLAFPLAMSSATSSLVGFYVLGLVAIMASLRVIMHPNPVHAILSMIVSLLAVAGIFFLIGAPLSKVEYPGYANDAKEASRLNGQIWATPVGVALIIALILFAMIADMGQVASVGDAGLIGADEVTAQQVGIRLFTDYGLLVEVAGLLLLAALVSAYHIGKKAIDDENVSHGSMKHDMYDEQGEKIIVINDTDDSNHGNDNHGKVRAHLTKELATQAKHGKKLSTDEETP